MSTSLLTELERIASAIEDDKAEVPEISMASIGERIAKHLGVKTEELAILGVSYRWRHLHFLVPPALKNVGFHSAKQQFRTGGKDGTREPSGHQ